MFPASPTMFFPTQLSQERARHDSFFFRPSAMAYLEEIGVTARDLDICFFTSCFLPTGLSQERLCPRQLHFYPWGLGDDPSCRGQCGGTDFRQMLLDAISLDTIFHSQLESDKDQVSCTPTHASDLRPMIHFAGVNVAVLIFGSFFLVSPFVFPKHICVGIQHEQGQSFHELPCQHPLHHLPPKV